MAKLTPEQQKILKQAADNSMLFHKDLWTKMIAEEKTKLKNNLMLNLYKSIRHLVQAVKSMHDTAKQNTTLKPYIERIEALSE